ncbi:SigE family RNA polymerase sigma factor [Kineosporia rhizophila]|uniref:SigE family RNA polymerase sigma factor n=1 Tax=Kineosporia TaxID=49184 RepID=UPI000AF8F370|nr:MULTISPECIES: SigE family RNA polymerase sigma factor [Kineosporia]MCE0536881.1 SigE family RNA polymerase sigma factor [Kineosporia rhizophila]GLY19036.1 RNA polymerase sigma24 factor [Kineosporia sp. NBRC 101677]
MPRSNRDEEFATFVRTNRTSLLKFACLLTAGDGHQAEDLVQTALTKVYLAWPRLRRKDGELAYARRTLLNSHIDETRRPWWRRERSTPELPEVPAFEGPEGIAGLDEGRFGSDGQRVRDALAALPSRMRAVVILRYWLDLSVEESARILGCTQGTVKSQAAKGTAKLRDLLTVPPQAVAPAYQMGRTNR